MGLDLCLNYRKKTQEILDCFDEDDQELAYGRKTWTIYYFLKEHSSTQGPFNEVYKIEPEGWDAFVKTLKIAFDANGGLDHVESLLSKEDEHYDDEDDREYNEIYEEIEDIVDDWSDISCQLGYVWELAALVRWYKADKKVHAAFERGDEVYMLASY